MPKPSAVAKQPSGYGDTPELGYIRCVVQGELGLLKTWLEERLDFQEEMLQGLARNELLDIGPSAEAPSQNPRVTAFMERSASMSVPPESTPKLETAVVAASPASVAAATDLAVSSDSRVTRNAPVKSVAYWQEQLMQLFDVLDEDGSGRLERDEFVHAFDHVGIPQIDVFQSFANAGTSVGASIDRDEWFRMIESSLSAQCDEHHAEFVDFAQKLLEANATSGEIFKGARKRKTWSLISHTSAVRVAWDMLMMLLLLYIAITLPLSLGFGEIPAFLAIDQAADVLFLVDIAFNFRTTYINAADVIVWDGSKIACHYLQTWFLLDLISSVPWDLASAGMLPNMQAARLLKIAKIAKVVKLLRLGRLLSAISDSELMEQIEDMIPRYMHQALRRSSSLFFVFTLLCHWLTCFLSAFDGAAIDQYLGSEESQKRRYLTGLYWAVTTMTTVGYGDLTPKSDGGRLFTMLAMIIGGGFYGYAVGVITSFVSSLEVNVQAQNDSREKLEAWLTHHSSMPVMLRRRIRRHHKRTWYAKISVDDPTMMNGLSHELRSEVAFYVLPEYVRFNAMFNNLHSSALATLVDVLKKISANRKETIVGAGDPGVAMYIILKGSAVITQGALYSPEESEDMKRGIRPAPLTAGDSFGEEIIFGLEEFYNYTIVADSDLIMYELLEDEFKQRFKNLPDLLRLMVSNYRNSKI